LSRLHKWVQGQSGQFNRTSVINQENEITILRISKQETKAPIICRWHNYTYKIKLLEKTVINNRHYGMGYEIKY
jgi:hypothetical protein